MCKGKKVFLEIMWLIILGSLCFFYTTIINGRLRCEGVINCAELVTNSLFIATIMIIFLTNENYINKLYRYVSISLAAVGFISNSYILFIQLNPEMLNQLDKLSKVFYINNFFAAFIGIFIYFSYKKNIKVKNVAYITGGIILIVSYLALRSNYKLVTNLQAYGVNGEKIILQCITILSFSYLYYKLIRAKGSFTNQIFIYFNIFFVIRIGVEVYNLFTIETFQLLNYVHSHLILLIGNYFIAKIIIIQVIKAPNETLYNTLNNQSKNLDDILIELKRKSTEQEIEKRILSNISHEFKTPINVIYSAVQMQEVNMAKGDITTVTKYNSIIKKNCLRLIRLIDNFIDSCKLTDNYYKTNLKSENIVEIVEDTTMSVISFVENKGLELVFDTEEEEAYALIDKDLFERVILNILSNSIKYNKKNGKIFVKVLGNSDIVSVQIKDTGVGIPKDRQQKIFERFERGDSELSKSKEGSGLGLNIVKEIIRVHNGYVGMESEVNQGTTVVINIPRLKENTPENVKINLGKDRKIQGDVNYNVELEMADII